MLLPLLATLTAPAPQTLHTTSPTRATVSFTVTTRPARTTLGAHALHWMNILLRVLLGLTAVGVVWAKWSAGRYGAAEVFKENGEVGVWAQRVVEGVRGWGWGYVCAGAGGVLGVVVRRGYTEETLTILTHLGIQLSTSPPTYLQSARRRFIPSSEIQDLIIHEAFRGFEVRFYLAIVVRGEGDVVVVFPELLPRRAMLEEVWRGARGCLWEGEGRGRESGAGGK
ncbi:GPI-GlcNAc transferase complex, PIG-H component-domain-containing protein [Boeremia exigua]|uniref:GPI-GlcNAc transferase complex, PIG-H component-domain-containing protein n=1 Tax=Boeremia exigua TaxID=749465 RepID=UPI001E8DA997|nr:GPI-GlcNAc transferase complex, PIG-H component-domain-containing protein [Boeremia exigua]KAH6621896.1 GPI-GlcNAc transferase complex, PIG-H component-domain-containing protein [Boeremia exigua]